MLFDFSQVKVFELREEENFPLLRILPVYSVKCTYTLCTIYNIRCLILKPMESFKILFLLQINLNKDRKNRFQVPASRTFTIVYIFFKKMNNSTSTCYICETRTTKTCSGCKTIKYCSVECQTVVRMNDL